MPENGHRHAETSQRRERRATLSARRRIQPRAVTRWVWIVGVIATLASMAGLLMGLEPSPLNYASTLALMASMGLLAFVSATRALNVGAAFEETVLEVEEIERSYRSLRQVVTTAMDLRENVSGDRSDRVVELSLTLGRGLGLGDERLRHLEWAAFLHDIGKVRVDDGILTKPGPLDAVEWDEMQQHPYFSYSILTQVEHLRDAAEIVYCHHERYDGMGYPRGLRGAEIPLEARVFAVADAYGAMVSDRPFRRALSHTHAVREIIGHAGTQFDPQVVAVFAEWAATVSDEVREVVAEEMRRLPAGWPQLEKARWA